MDIEFQLKSKVRKKGARAYTHYVVCVITQILHTDLWEICVISSQLKSSGDLFDDQMASLSLFTLDKREVQHKATDLVCKRVSRHIGCRASALLFETLAWQEKVK